MPQQKKTIFNCYEINDVCRIAVVKAQVEAKAKAKAKGEDEDIAAAKAKGDFSKIFSIGRRARKGGNGTKWIDLFATTPKKGRARLVVRMKAEISVGQNAPLDQQEVIRMNKNRGKDFSPLSARDRDPTISIQKYNVRIETDDSGKLKGPLPGNDAKSPYFEMITYIDDFFYAEMKNRIERGMIAVHDPRVDTYPAGCITVSSAKIISMYQRTVSQHAKRNAGAKLSNPIVRISMKFDKNTNLAKGGLSFYDFTKAYENEKTGKRNFEELKFDGSPVTAHNAHLIESHSTISGIINLDAVCASNMGISIPTKAEALVIKRPVSYKTTVDDVFEDDFFDDESAPVAQPAAVAPVDMPAAVAPVDVPQVDEVTPTTKVSDTATDQDIEDLIGDLGLND